MSTATANHNVGRRDEALSQGAQVNSFSGQAAIFDADAVQYKGQSLPEAAPFTQAPEYPDGTLLWRTMRSNDNSVSARSQEPMKTTGSIFDHSEDAVSSGNVPAQDVAPEPAPQEPEVASPNLTFQQPFSLDAKLVGQAQWSLSALDQVFTHMTSCFMEQVDFNKIDFEALAQA